jgi:hypothetical protein
MGASLGKRLKTFFQAVFRIGAVFSDARMLVKRVALSKTPRAFAGGWMLVRQGRAEAGSSAADR